MSLHKNANNLHVDVTAVFQQNAYTVGQLFNDGHVQTGALCFVHRVHTSSRFLQQ